MYMKKIIIKLSAFFILILAISCSESVEKKGDLDELGIVNKWNCCSISNNEMIASFNVCHVVNFNKGGTGLYVLPSQDSVLFRWNVKDSVLHVKQTSLHEMDILNFNDKFTFSYSIDGDFHALKLESENMNRIYYLTRVK